jgi:oligopeptide/dipeptide ABC transporter ATP-binding protein
MLLEVRNLKKYFHTPRGELHAVDDVSFSIESGKTMGLVGESGCGKSTLGRVVLHLIEATEGKIFFEGQDISDVRGGKRRLLQQRMQIIFQDPFSSLNPRMTVREIICEPLQIARKPREDVERKTSAMMDRVGLAKRLSNSYPHELDGGRRQRIGIARALVLEPKFVVCDEPVSALDVSIRAQIINLLLDLQKEMRLTYIFVTHDLSVVSYVSHEIFVMYLGKIVEKCPAMDLFKNPLHPYTKALLSAIPVPDVDYKRERIILRGELSSPINPKPGCRFAARCAYAKVRCASESPDLRACGNGHEVSCHFVEEINATGETRVEGSM